MYNKNKSVTKLIFLSILILFTTTNLLAQNHIKWMTWEEAQAANKKNPKKIFVDVYTDWCGWCKKMDATTFEDPKIVNYINKNFYAVKFNAEQKEEIIFNGKTYKYVSNGTRGYHELANELMQGRMSYPTSLYLDENLNLLSPVPGYQDVPTLEMILRFFGEKNYLTSTWEEYQKNYVAPK